MQNVAALSAATKVYGNLMEFSWDADVSVISFLYVYELDCIITIFGTDSFIILDT